MRGIRCGHESVLLWLVAGECFYVNSLCIPWSGFVCDVEERCATCRSVSRCTVDGLCICNGITLILYSVQSDSLFVCMGHDAGVIFWPKCTKLQDLSYTISKFFWRWYTRDPAAWGGAPLPHPPPALPKMLGPRHQFPLGLPAFPLFQFYETTTATQCCCQDLFSGLETKTETFALRSRDRDRDLSLRSRDQDQDLWPQVSRPRPRPLPITSGDRDLYVCEDLAAKIHAFFTQSSTQFS